MASQVTRSRRHLPQQSEQYQSRARWTDTATDSITKIFEDLMVDQVQRGNRLNNSFTKKAWKSMPEECYRTTGLRWDKKQLRNRYSVLRKQHAIVNSLLERTDFSLDESTGTLTASDDAWREYIKEHPDAETIRSGRCPIYMQLCVIFSDPVSNGRHYESAEGEGDILSSFPCRNNVLDESSSGSEEMDGMEDDQDAFQPAMHNTIANTKKGRKGIDDAIAEAILHMAAVSKLRTAAIRQINARYSIADCIRQLDQMQGVEQEVYFAALDLFKNPSAREIFLSLKGDKLLIWSRGKCTSQV